MTKSDRVHCRHCHHISGSHMFPNFCTECPNGICEAGGDFSEPDESWEISDARREREASDPPPPDEPQDCAEFSQGVYDQMIRRGGSHDPLVQEPGPKKGRK